MNQNLLGKETSPYLLQHRDNPVHWRPWGEDAFEAARRENKPILLSVGYSACHWCHVMAHESFEDDAIADLMNELFINIKVDREERPDVDNVYQTALALLGEQGGWPLTIFLTPRGEPFWGGTYFPSTPRYGRPGFPDILRRIFEIHQSEPDKVKHNVGALREAMTKLATPPGEGGLNRDTLDAAAELALRAVDNVQGGTHGAPKFPQPGFFRFLWRAYLRTGMPAYRQAVTTTLDAICQGGIYDHLGGGFARYSTDAAWLVPHFEKMLYDNAQILELLAETWRTTNAALYAVRARETVEWVLRDMRVPADPADDGLEAPFAFASAFDADSEGVEGRYYVWSEAEIDEILGKDAAAFKSAYSISPGGNWEGTNIPNRSHVRGLGDDAEEAQLAAARLKLLSVRDGRVPPLRDDKVLADWNGLMIAALANAGVVFREPAWIDHARTAFDFICAHMTTEGRLRHSWRTGKARHPAVLDDYANMARAALALLEATGNEAYLTHAETWTSILDQRYWDPALGGYFLTADDTTDLITRPKTSTDNAVPPGNGTMAEVLARLFLTTGNTDYRDRAEALVHTFTRPAPEHQVSMPTLCVGFEILHSAVQVAIVGPDDNPATDALVRAAQDHAPPIRVLTRISPDQGLAPGHPAQGKGLVDGQPAAYVCVGAACGLPVTDPQALRDELSAL